MRRTCLQTLLALPLCAGVLLAPAYAQEPQSPPTVLRLAPNAGDIEVRGSLTGYQTLTYLFDGAPGLDMVVRLDHPGQVSLYHNVIAPSGATIFNGSADGPRFRAMLREYGRYQVQVYLMRNDARRGKRVSFTLRVRQSGMQAQSPRPPQGSGPSFDCRRARSPVETAICRSPALSELDARLDFVYRDALAGAPGWRANEIRRDQRAWLEMRDSCVRERDIERCLSRRYLARIGTLEPKR